MSPAKVFGIVIRSFGLMILFYSIWFLLTGFATIAGMPGTKSVYIVGYFFSGLIFLFISLYLLRGAKQLVAFCYPEENP